eukprot:scaffold155665_cov40-Attheya_sp.AAC.2
MAEACRTVAKEARIVIGHNYGVEFVELQAFEEVDSLQPVVRPDSAERESPRPGTIHLSSFKWESAMAVTILTRGLAKPNVSPPHLCLRNERSRTPTWVRNKDSIYSEAILRAYM